MSDREKESHLASCATLLVLARAVAEGGDEADVAAFVDAVKEADAGAAIQAVRSLARWAGMLSFVKALADEGDVDELAPSPVVQRRIWGEGGQLPEQVRERQYAETLHRLREIVEQRRSARAD